MIILEPDPDVEPGHQWIQVPITPDGYALCRLLTGRDPGIFTFLLKDGSRVYRLPHDAIVDARILDLINPLSHVRFSAPDLVQLTLTESPE